MNVEELKERYATEVVEYWNNPLRDVEVAHMNEDELMRDVIVELAESSPLAQTMADLLEEYGGETRWYA